MIRQQLMGLAIASRPKCLNLNLRTSGHCVVVVGICVQNLMTMRLASVS
jgi:hypothetical protein